MKVILKVFKYSLIVILAFIALFFLLLVTGLIWKSPPYFEISTKDEFVVPIMDMGAYDTLGYHARPYIYKVSGSNGSVYVLGIEHTQDKHDPQIDSIRTIWHTYKPEIALVEGRLGFLFSPLQNAVEELGEGGETMRLSKKDNVPIYTWEPQRDAEVKLLLQKHHPKHVALFYTLRPYFSNMRFGKPENPDKKVKEYLESRTDYDGIRNQISTVEQIDSIWQSDFSREKNWRHMSDEYGYPKGYLFELANLSNLSRDLHLCSIIIDQVKSGKKVFVTMGSSHAFRIEETLKAELE